METEVIESEGGSLSELGEEGTEESHSLREAKMAGRYSQKDHQRGASLRMVRRGKTRPGRVFHRKSPRNLAPSKGRAEWPSLAILYLRGTKKG